MSTLVAPYGPNSGRRRSSVKPNALSQLSMTSSGSSSYNSLPRRPSTPSLSHAQPTTIIKTFPIPQPLPAYNSELPFLPVPELEDSMARYLKSVRPFLNDVDYEHTAASVKDFLENGTGKKLHERLLQRAKASNKLGQAGYLKELHRGADGITLPTRANWLIDWWNEYSYYAFRDPNPINVNYFFVFPDDTRPGAEALKYTRSQGYSIQTKRAASMVVSAMEFREQLRTGQLQADMVGKPAQAMDMGQYRYLFNASRIPANPSDYVETFPAEENWHVCVMRMNKMWSFDTRVDGRLMTVEEVELQLRRISEDSPTTPAAPLGALTAADRDSWSAARPLLLSSHPSHPDLIKTLESSAFLLCLDTTSPVTRAEVARGCWHGDGQNRWFDKSFQLIAFANGKCGFNGEHSAMDATPTARLGDFICERLGKVIFGEELPMDYATIPAPAPLDFHPPASLIMAIASSLDSFTRAVSRHDLHVVRYTRFGKDLPKTHKMSPDAFVQMAFQLAYYRAFGTWVATYESAGMRRYLWGRTETCRSVTTESVDLIRGWHGTATPLEKAKLLRAACGAQSKYMVDCLQGKGIDRYMLGLRLMIRKDEQVPALWADPAFAVSSHWTMSTSQIASEFFDGYGWGEVVPDGFGLAYMVREKSIHVNVTGLIGTEADREANGEEADPSRVARMAHLLEEVFDEMKEVLEAAKIEEDRLKAAEEAAKAEFKAVVNGGLTVDEAPANVPIVRPVSSSLEAINASRPPVDSFFSRNHETAASQILSHAEREGHGSLLRARRASVASLSGMSLPRPMSPMHAPTPSRTPPPATIETAGTQGIGVDSLGLSLAYPSRHTLSEMVYNQDDGLLEGLGYIEFEEETETPRMMGKIGFLGRRLASLWGWEK